MKVPFRFTGEFAELAPERSNASYLLSVELSPRDEGAGVSCMILAARILVQGVCFFT